ncbi:hypothetical protein FACS1894176_07380 [Bacteroidia bacterium]|nr:hypothetical protein FACS1894176_07380 [Bacteroidia bacterium]
MQTFYQSAYEWAKEYGITTASTYAEARPTDAILRQEMAKMISTYAIKLFQKTPDTSKVNCSHFQDLREAPTELQSYIIQSCQLVYLISFNLFAIFLSQISWLIGLFPFKIISQPAGKSCKSS